MSYAALILGLSLSLLLAGVIQSCQSDVIHDGVLFGGVQP